MARTHLEDLSVMGEMTQNQSSEFIGDSQTCHCGKGVMEKEETV